MSTKALKVTTLLLLKPCDGTWLRVREIDGISVQLHQLVRLGLLLPVAAHSKRVLTHLQQTHIYKSIINT